MSSKETLLLKRQMWPIGRSEGGDVVYTQASHAHHLLYVTIAEIVAAVPAHAQTDDRWLEAPPLDRVFVLLQEYDSGRAIDKLTGGL